MIFQLTVQQCCDKTIILVTAAACFIMKILLCLEGSIKSYYVELDPQSVTENVPRTIPRVLSHFTTPFKCVPVSLWLIKNQVIYRQKVKFPITAPISRTQKAFARDARESRRKDHLNGLISIHTWRINAKLSHLTEHFSVFMMYKSHNNCSRHKKISLKVYFPYHLTSCQQQFQRPVHETQKIKNI